MELGEPVAVKMLPEDLVCWVESPVVTVGTLDVVELRKLEGVVGFE